MATNRRKYTKEFKIEAVRLLETSGKSQTTIEEELGIGAGCLSRWKGQYGEGKEPAGAGPKGLLDEQQQIRKLERENEILRQERDILKKAVTIFSRTQA